MKSGTYKRQNGKVVEITNNNSNLQDDSPEAVLLAVYQELFDLIDKGSKVVNFVKTSQYKDGLQDVLQEVLAKQLETKEYLDYSGSIKSLINRRLADRTKNLIRDNQTFDIFKADNSEYVESQDYGVTKQYLNEMLQDVKRILTVSEWQIFKLYHVEGYSIRTIADKINSNRSDVSRRLTAIFNKVVGTDKTDGLCFKTVFDSRYIAYQSQGKKRQHKRKVMTQKEIIALSGKPYHVDISDYKPMESKPESIDMNKCQQYPTKGYFKVKASEFAYRDSTNTNEYILVSNFTSQI